MKVCESRFRVLQFTFIYIPAIHNTNNIITRMSEKFRNNQITVEPTELLGPASPPAQAGSGH